VPEQSVLISVTGTALVGTSDLLHIGSSAPSEFGKPSMSSAPVLVACALVAFELPRCIIFAALFVLLLLFFSMKMAVI
jgi:hypothetical protein